MTELRFDEKTAGVLLSRAEKFKPKGFARAMKVDSAFELFISGETISGEAGDYLVLLPDGRITIQPNGFIMSHYEPVKKRERKNVPKS